MDSKKEAKHKQRSNTSKSTTSATSRLSQTSASSHHGSLRRSSSSSNLDPRRYREQKNPEPKSPSPASTSAQEISPPASPGTHLAQLLQRSAISDRSRSPSRSGSRQATTHDSSAQRRHHSTRSKSPAPGDRSGRKSKDFTLLEAASSPLLTLRKGAQPDGSRTTTHSSTRLKKHLHRWTGNAQKQQKQQQQQEKEENVETSQDETANSSDKSLTCPTCGTQLPSRDSYKKHVDTLGHGYECSSCGAKFADMGNLNNNEKPYICDICAMEFVFRDALRRHVQSVHWNMRPFRCASCDRTYKKKDHLKRHLAAFPDHKGE